MPVIIFILCLFLLAPGGASAQWQGGEEPDRFNLRLGGQFFTSFDTRLRVDSDTGGRGTELHLEGDLNVDKQALVVRLDGTYNFNRRHSISFSYYQVDRSGERRLQNDISFANWVYTFGTDVVKDQRFEIFKLSYGYNFLFRPKGTLGVTFGIHAMSFYSTLSALDGSVTNEADADAPVPVIGLRGHYQFAEKWRLVGTYDRLDLSIDDVKGHFGDFIVSVEHDTFNNVSFGFGLNRLNLNVDARDENLQGKIKIGFNSALLYVRVRFGAS